MLAAVFSFRGRVDRTQYFFGNLALAAGLALLAVLLIGFIDLPATTQPSIGLAIDAVLLVLMAPLVVLAGCSLQARRLRDIGWSPLVALPLWIGAIVLAALLLGSMQSQIAAGTAINFVMLTCLYVWPGNRGGVRFTSARGRFGAARSSAPAFASRRLEPVRIGR